MQYVLGVNLKTQPADSTGTLMMETAQYWQYIEDRVRHAILNIEYLW
jgi:hypothetical protein